MSENISSTESVLDPVDRITEILFGLIMVLSFTCSMSAADVGRDDIRAMLIGAFGCNLAWGIVDALMYLVTTVTTRGRVQLLAQRLTNAPSPEAGQQIVAEWLPNGVGQHSAPEHLEHLRKILLQKITVSPPKALTWIDLVAAWKIFWLVFLSTFPVGVPFIIIQDPRTALRVSNIIAIVLLFQLGYILGRYTGQRRALWGLSMALLGAILVWITVSLGG